MVLWLHCLLVEVELALERSDLFRIPCHLNHFLDLVYAHLFPRFLSLLGSLLLKLVLFLASEPLYFLPPHLNFSLIESRLLLSSQLFHLLLFELVLLAFHLFFLLSPHHLSISVF